MLARSYKSRLYSSVPTNPRSLSASPSVKSYFAVPLSNSSARICTPAHSIPCCRAFSAAPLPPPHHARPEDPDQPFHFRACPIRYRTAHSHIRLTAVARQQQLPRSQQRHEQRHTLTLAQLLQPPRHILR